MTQADIDLLIGWAQLLVRAMALPAALFTILGAWRARVANIHRAVPWLLVTLLAAGAGPLLDQYAHGTAQALQTMLEAVMVVVLAVTGGHLFAAPRRARAPVPAPSEPEPSAPSLPPVASDQWLAALWDSSVLVMLVDPEGYVQGHLGGALRGAASVTPKGHRLPEASALSVHLTAAISGRVCFRHNEGSRRFIVTGEPWYDPVGEPRGAVFIAVDVTDTDESDR